MRKTAILVALLLAATPVLAPAQAIGVQAAGVNTSGTNVTLTTTSETSIISSGAVTLPRANGIVVVIAWAQLTTGAATTTVTPRIRQGTATTGTLVGEANAVTIGAAAGSTEVFTIFVSEERSNVANVQYNLTLQQAAATGNGTALQAGILVLIL